MDNSIIVKTNDAFKVCEDICNRLLNHRQFTSGEIRYVIKEFEEKHSGDVYEQFTGLASKLNSLPNTYESSSDSVSNDYHDNLKGLSTKVDQLIKLGSQFAELEKSSIEKRKQQTEKLENLHMENVQQISSENQAKFKEIDSLFESQENDLKQFYAGLESKWTLNNST